MGQELNRKSFTGVPQYYHLKKKQHPLPHNNMSEEIRATQGFQPVYSLRIASSRTEIGADKNEYTSYIIVGSRISPFDSKITVCVKRFTELRGFASEIVRRLSLIGKEIESVSDFPYHTRLFGVIDKKQLEERRNAINAYLESVCADENAVRHSYFLSFFDFNDGRYLDIDDYDEKYLQIDKYNEEEFRLKCIEETLEIIGMNGGIPLDEDSDDDNEWIDNAMGTLNEWIDTELNFEVPYDLHHYKNPEYKLIAAIFDIIQQQLEENDTEQNDDFDDENEGDMPNKPRLHQKQNSNFMNSYRASINEWEHEPSSKQQQMRSSNSSKIKHSRKMSGGGMISPAPLKHLRATSIIESSFTPATPMEFHPSISSINGKVMENDINTNNIVQHNGWTANKFKHKFNSSIRGIDGGPRIIRTASEATSDRSLSYKIPTMVAEVWSKLNALLNMKKDKIPILLAAVNKELYPIIQEAMNDVAPIIKLIYNNNPAMFVNGKMHKLKTIESEQTDGSNKSIENGGGNGNNVQKHGKYLSMFGYDGDEDSSSDDSDASDVHRSIGIRHFPFLNAMKQYCMTESRLYEFFLAFENLAIDQVFGDINVIFGVAHKSKTNIQQKSKKRSTTTTNNNNNANKYKRNRKYKSSVDFGDYIVRHNVDDDYMDEDKAALLEQAPHYEYIHLLKYNYAVLDNTSSQDFTDRIQHIERIHDQINLILCEIIYATLKCMMKCLGDIILYKDQLEEKYASCGNAFDQDVINNHEDSLLNILRDSGYNISFIVDDLKQKIKSEFKDYSSVIFNPLLDGISTIGEISLNCICLMISQFVFDDGEFPKNIDKFRELFIAIWFDPIDYYLADFTECVFYILYQSSIGLVHSASQDLLERSIFNSSSHSSHSSSTWYQILRGQNIEQIRKFIPKELAKSISVKDILDLVIERTLTNIVDETLIYIKLECEKNFFLKFQKKEQRLFNHDF